jgi:hypothetical protein
MTVVLGLVVHAGARTADAQPAAVEDLIRQGVELRTAGKDQRALPLFQKAYDLDRSARTAAQLGLCEATLGYWLSAEQHLEEALSTTMNPWLAKHEAKLRETLLAVRASIGEVEVRGSPAGAEVLVNGQAVGTVPLAKPIRVSDGAVQVTLRKTGYKEGSARTRVQGGQRVVVALALEALPAVAAADAKPVQPPASEAARGEAPRSRAKQGSTPWLRPAAWVTAAGAVVALGVGAYALKQQWTHGREFDRYRDPTTGGMCYTARTNRGAPGCQNLYNKTKSDQKLMFGGFLAAGVLTAGSVVAFALSSPGSVASTTDPESGFSLQLGDGNSTPISAAWAFSF